MPEPQVHIRTAVLRATWSLLKGHRLAVLTQVTCRSHFIQYMCGYGWRVHSRASAVRRSLLQTPRGCKPYCTSTPLLQQTGTEVTRARGTRPVQAHPPQHDCESNMLSGARPCTGGLAAGWNRSPHNYTPVVAVYS